MYDLLLKGGTVVDPSAGLDGVHDIAVEHGQIARIAPDIPAAEAARTIAVTGRSSRPASSTCTPTCSRASTAPASIPISAASSPG